MSKPTDQWCANRPILYVVIHIDNDWLFNVITSSSRSHQEDDIFGISGCILAACSWRWACRRPSVDVCFLFHVRRWTPWARMTTLHQRNDGIDVSLHMQSETICIFFKYLHTYTVTLFYMTARTHWPTTLCKKPTIEMDEKWQPTCTNHTTIDVHHTLQLVQLVQLVAVALLPAVSHWWRLQGIPLNSKMLRLWVWPKHSYAG